MNPREQGSRTGTCFENRKERMIETIERMLRDLEGGKLSRRQFAVSLAALAAGAYAVPGALAVPAPTGFRAATINHVTVRVPDLHRTSQFYQEFFGMPLKQQSATVHILGVGDSFFGVEQGESKATATVDHYDFGIASFNADEVRAKLSERGLKFDGTSKESFKFFDPDGFHVQVNAPDYVGHVS
jgi:catechol 2,3-dioxygenase-like lactoylglutathione lyase family enzyme